MVKKLITFNEIQDEILNGYASKFKITYTEAVRRLVLKGSKENTNVPEINPVEEGHNELSDIKKQISDMKEKLDAIGWFKLDEIESEISRINYKLNLLTKVSKIFKEHLKNKDLHES